MILCLGEALVDMLCERRIGSLRQADAFRPHFGGALANVAVAAARAGARVALASGAGDDEWGRWLRERLAEEGVETACMALVPGERTPLAVATFDHAGEPSFAIYGAGLATGLEAIEATVSEALPGAEALVLGSNTLAEPREREVTMRLLDRAAERGVRVCFDPNLRPNRWRELDRGHQLCRELAARAWLLRANAAEAEALTGERDPAVAAEALAALGPRLAVVTEGAAGAVLRGAVSEAAPSPAVELVSPLGAGDAFMGALVAGLAALDWDERRAGEALAPACRAGAEACHHWGATGPAAP